MLWVSGLFWFLQRSRITKVTFTGMAWGNAHRREICICAIGGDKLGGMPDTGRIHIFIALTFLLHNLCVTIEGCRQMGSSFVKGEYFRYYSWDFISSFFFARQPVRDFREWSPGGALILLEDSFPCLVFLVHLLFGLDCAPCHGAIPLYSTVEHRPRPVTSNWRGIWCMLVEMTWGRVRPADAPLLEGRLITKEG